MSIGRTRTRTRAAAVRRPRGYLVFLGFPLLWLVSTLVQVAAGVRQHRRRRLIPQHADAGQLHATRSSEQGLVRPALQQPAIVALAHDPAD